MKKFRRTKVLLSCILVFSIWLTNLFSVSGIENNIDYVNGVDIEEPYIPELPDLEDEPEYPQFIPSIYDPRTINKVTLVKNQGNRGTCGIFATNAVFETASLYKTGIKYRYSEEAICSVISSDLLILNGYDPDKYSGAGFYTYGNSEGRAIEKVVPYLTNRNTPIIDGNSIKWIAPNLEQDIPYTLIKDDVKLPNQEELTDSYCNNYVAGTRYINTQSIKSCILDYGAVYVTFLSDVANGNFNPNTNAFYKAQYYSDTEPRNNHAVAVVGWDDNYSKTNFNIGHQPEHDGAWLVKNSWGTDNVGYGYYWISYDDISFNYHNNAMIIDDIEKARKNEYMLSYDFMPMTTYENLSVSNSSVYIANVYDVSELLDVYDYIDKVMIYSNNIGDSYCVYITSVDANENIPNVNDIGNALGYGYVDGEGYSTVYLNKPYYLQENEKIAIIVKYITDKSEVKIPRENRGPYYTPWVGQGESYKYINGTWIDIAGNSGTSYYGNYCIRPILVDEGYEVQNATLSKNEVFYENSDISININLNGTLLYSIRNNGYETMYQDRDYIINGDIVTIKKSFLESLNHNIVNNIIFEFTDGESQTLKILPLSAISSVEIVGKPAIDQTLTVVCEDKYGNIIDLDNLNYQWQASLDGSNWVNINENSDKNTFILTQNEFLKYLRVVVIDDYSREIISSPTEMKTILYGDVTLDCILQIEDITLLQMYVANSTNFTNEQLFAADVDGDGAITTTDVTYVSMKIANSDIKFPVE